MLPCGSNVVKLVVGDDWATVTVPWLLLADELCFNPLDTVVVGKYVVMGYVWPVPARDNPKQRGYKVG